MRNHHGDHGGDLDRAMALHGAGPWLDLSTGINARPYPLPEIPARSWNALPTRREITGLERAAQEAYRVSVRPVALAGAQAAIQLVPRLRPAGMARVLAPTYNEHAAALSMQGWQVREVPALEDLAGAQLAVVVNPNNPDGRRWSPGTLAALGETVDILVVDESFADPEPDHSLAPRLSADTENLVVLRSFGKFYGLAGLRLGFVLTGDSLAGRIRALAGPWAVGGPAAAIGQVALGDDAWRANTIRRLSADAARLDALADRAGWSLVGGTSLFRTYATPHAGLVQSTLAHHRIWSRVFPYSATWLRLGLPGSGRDWRKLEEVFPRLEERL